MINRWTRSSRWIRCKLCLRSRLCLYTGRMDCLSPLREILLSLGLHVRLLSKGNIILLLLLMRCAIRGCEL